MTGVGSVGRVLLVYSGGGGPTQHSSRGIIAADSGVAAAMNYGNTQISFHFHIELNECGVWC